MNLYFTYESRDTLKSFTLFITVKTISKLNAKHSDRYEIKQVLKFSCRGPRSPDNAEFAHFTLLFCRGRQRNVPRFKTHVHSHCLAHSTFCLVAFPLPLPSWFRKLPIIHREKPSSLQGKELAKGLILTVIHKPLWH